MGNCDSDTNDYDEEASRVSRRQVFDAKIQCSLLRMELAEKQKKKAEEKKAIKEKEASLKLQIDAADEDIKRLWSTLRAPQRAAVRAKLGDDFCKDLE